MNTLPPTRANNIVLQDLGKEILVYDLNINKALCLNSTVSSVYRNCDGHTSFAELKLIYDDFSDEIIFLTLDLLLKENLIESENYQSPIKGVSRREVVRKVALASLTVLPVISSIVAPTSVMAASICSGTLVANADTGWHCNFAPGTGSAAFCNQIQCNESYVGNLCQSCSARAVLDSSVSPDFYRCRCN